MAALGADSVDSLHVQIEAMKLAFADIGEHVSDIDTMRLKPTALLDKSYLKERAKLIDMKRASTPKFGTPKGGTVYLTAADESGMMVSYIQSNFAGFGSGSSCRHRREPAKPRLRLQSEARPRQPRCPAQAPLPYHHSRLHHEERRAADELRRDGGSMQAQGHMQITSRLVDYRQNPQAASDAPRWRIDSGVKVGIEWNMPEDVVIALRARATTCRSRAAGPPTSAALTHSQDAGRLLRSFREATDGQAVGY